MAREEPGTRDITITVTATSLSEAMERAHTEISSDTVRVLEITDAGLQVGDSYLVTALVTDRSLAQRR